MAMSRANRDPHQASRKVEALHADHLFCFFEQFHLFLLWCESFCSGLHSAIAAQFTPDNLCLHSSSPYSNVTLVAKSVQSENILRVFLAIILSPKHRETLLSTSLCGLAINLVCLIERRENPQ
jgi:hypothetical protein